MEFSEDTMTKPSSTIEKVASPTKVYTSSRDKFSVSSRYLELIFNAITRQQGDSVEFKRSIGYQKEGSEKTSFTYYGFEDVLDLAVKHTGNLHISAIAGLLSNFNDHGVLGYAMLAADCVHSSIETMVTYCGRRVSGLEMELSVQGEVAYLQLRGTPMQCNSANLTQMIMYCGLSLILGIYPQSDMWLEMNFTRKRTPNEFDRTNELSGRNVPVTVKFDQKMNSFCFPTSFLYIKNRQANPSVYASMLQNLKKISQQDVAKSTVSGEDDLVLRIKSIMTENRVFKDSKTLIAEELLLTVSTLSRRLAKLKTSFKRVAEDAKGELAVGYLIETDKAVSEIAFLLNYNETTNFCRAFKRWSGMSPAEYRESFR